MRVAIIGADGHVGTVFGGKLPYEPVGVSLSGAPLENAAAVEAMAQRQQTPFYTDWRRMLAETHPDAAVVSTTFPYNGPITAEALSTGLAVYEEKPVATDRDTFRAVEKAAKAPGAFLFAMLSLRYDPWFATARRLMDSGAIGEPRMVTGQKSYKMGKRPRTYFARETYGSTMAWVGIHALDQILWLTGKPYLPQTVTALHSSLCNGGHGTMEATSMTEFALEGQILCSMHADLLRPGSAPSHGDDRIRVAGTEGVLEVRGDRVYLINADHDGTEPEPLTECAPMFDHFLHLAAHPEARSDPFYRDCDGLYATRLALDARDAADRVWGENA